jgi:hypothetical protein
MSSVEFGSHSINIPLTLWLACQQYRIPASRLRLQRWLTAFDLIAIGN